MPSDDLSNLGIEADATDEVRRISANTETTALLRQVGLMPRDLDADIWNDAERIALRDRITTEIMNKVRRTRSNLTYVRLNDLLDKSIDAALQTVAPPPNGVGGRESVAQVLSQALYEALPKETWHVLTEEAINAKYVAGPDRDAALKFYEKLRTDNDANDMSAGMAMFMVMEDPSSAPVGNPASGTVSWESKYVSSANRAGHQAEIASLQQQKALYDFSKAFAAESLTVSYRYASNMEEVENEVAELPLDAAAVGSGATTWRSAAMRALYATETPDTLTKPTEQKAKKEAAISLLTEARQDLVAYRKLTAQLESIMRRLQAIFPDPAADCPNVSKYFNAGPPVSIAKDRLTAATTPAAIAADLEADLALARPMKNGKPFEKEADIQGKIDEETKKLAGAKDAKDVPGTDVQMAVFRSYIKRQQPALSAADVDQVAEYILNRTKVDNVLRSAVDSSTEKYLNVESRTLTDRTSNALFNWGESEWTSRVGSTLKEIALSLHIPVGPAGPNWQAADYEQASAAYFAIKELMDGKGPKELSLHRRPDQAVDAFRTLSRILSTRYAGQIERNLLKSLPDDEKKSVVRSRARTANAVKEFLRGDTPSWARKDVDDAHARADRQATWFMRGTYKLPSRAWAGASSVGSWMGSAAWKNTPSTATVKKYGTEAAKLAAWSVLGGPAIGIAAYLAMNHFSRKSESK